jgi:Glycosyltransferase
MTLDKKTRIESNKSLKILVVAEISGPGSGTYTFLLRLLEIQTHLNIETSVLISKDQATGEVMSELRKFNVAVYVSFFNRAPFFCKPIFSLFFDLLYVLPFFIKCRPDLIHVTHGTPGIFNSLFVLPVSVLHTLHTIPTRKLRYGLPCFLKRMLIKKNKLFNTVSSYCRNAIIDCFGIEQRHVRVIYNSNKNNFDVSPSIRNGRSDKSLCILTLGHVVDYKNPEGWLTVATSIIAVRPHVMFIWAGEGKLLRHFASLVKDTNPPERIKFVGYRKDTKKLYQDASIYFQPSILENHSISVVDAMFFSLPCVVSDAGGLPESVLDGVTGYVCPKTEVKTYTERLLQLIDNPSNAIAMGKKGRERAMQLFSQSTQESKYLELYSELTGTSFNV